MDFHYLDSLKRVQWIRISYLSSSYTTCQQGWFISRQQLSIICKTDTRYFGNVLRKGSNLWKFLLKKILLQRRVVVIFYWPNILKCHKILLICLFEIISFLEKKHFRNHFIWNLNIFWSASKFSTVILNSGNGRFELLTVWSHKFTIQNHIWPWNRVRIVQNCNLSVPWDRAA